MAHAYSLYDAGANARLAGNYADAIDKLNQSARLFNNANDYQHSGTSGTIESMVHFELGMAAEAAQDFGLARDSYQRCLIIRPNFTQASVRLVDMLARIGQGPLALAKAQEAVSANPSDPRSHLLLGLMLEKTGRGDLARASREYAKRLLIAPTSPPPVADRTGDIDEAKLPITDKIDADGSEQSGKTADSDVMGDEEGEEVPVP
jgi:hypothetical protein